MCIATTTQMEKQVSALSLDEINEEEDEIVLDEVPDDAPSEETYELCLVGRLITDKPFDFGAFRDCMASLWRPGDGVLIEDIGEKRLLFRFGHGIDLERVLELGPWSFDKSLLLLKRVQHGEHPQLMDLYEAEFWVQIHGLPHGYYSATVAEAMAEHVGRVITLDDMTISQSQLPYMRVRVALDIRQPLKRGKRIRIAGKQGAIGKFCYEKLPDFCYVCGRIGHVDRYCEVLFDVSLDQITRLWDKSLRAKSRKARTMTGTRWLLSREDWDAVRAQERLKWRLDLAGKPCSKVYTKDNPDLHLTIRDGKLMMARSDPNDPCQNWFKDEQYSTSVTDEEGYPCFALVNKATGQAMKHSVGDGHPVELIPYEPDVLDESVLWSQSRDMGEGFRAMRMVNNIWLYVDAFYGDKQSGGVRDGTTIVLWQLNEGDNQLWKIVPDDECKKLLGGKRKTLRQTYERLKLGFAAHHSSSFIGFLYAVVCVLYAVVCVYLLLSC